MIMSAFTGSIYLTMLIPDSPLRSVWCHWGTLIRLHVVSSCSQQLSCPDMYTVAVFMLYSTHSGSFSQPVDGLTHLWLNNTQPMPLPPNHPIELIHDIGGGLKKASQIQQY